MKILKRDDQLHYFRRLEQRGKRLVECECIIESLRLCKSFDLTPTFARVDKSRLTKCKHSPLGFQKNLSMKNYVATCNNLESLEEKCE